MTRSTLIPSLIELLFILFLVSCGEPSSKPKTTIPESDLGHIDMILDSTTYIAIKGSPFIQNEFGVLYIDTAHYGGKPSYDLYVLGHLNFLHFSLARGFWDNQQGGGVLVFQTRKPGMADSLLNTWKQFYKDSLSIHTYKGPDFTLDEVMAWYPQDTSKLKEPSIYPNLTSYSAEAYRNWGITDSIVNAGLSMRRFLQDWGGKDLESKLFRSITEIHMTLTQREHEEIRSSLLATGYEEKDKSFAHPFNPSIFITLTDEKGKSRYSSVKLSLNESVRDTEIVFSPGAKLKLSANEGWLILN